MCSDQEWADAFSALDFARRLAFFPDEQQARVLESEVRRGILNCTRQWGKSSTAAVKALHQAWSRPHELVLVASPSERQSRLFVRTVRGFVRRLGITPRGDGDNAISVMLPNRSRIVGLPGTEGTTRGFANPGLLLFDEAARVSDEVYEGLLPMLATGNGALWLMSTPRGKRGFFWREWSEGGEQWVRVSVPATECPRISKEFLEEERRRHPERVFRQEYMCEFVESEHAIFREEDVRRCVRDDIPGLRLGDAA